MQIRKLTLTTKNSLDFWSSHRIDGLFNSASMVFVYWGIVLSILSFTVRVQAIGGIGLDLRIVDGNFHLEFSGANEWDYDLEKKEQDQKTSLELRVPSLKPQTEEQLKKIPKNEVVESVFLERVPGGSKDILTINLSSNLVESFDYLTEKPSRLIIDLYLTKKSRDTLLSQGVESKKTKSISQNKNSLTEKSNKLPDKITSAKTDSKKREPAADEMNLKQSEDLAAKEKEASSASASSMSGIFDGGDPNFERFMVRDHEIKEDAIVRSKENLYIPFPMLIVEGAHFSEIKSKPPIYEVAPKDTEENKMARLVLKLFENNRLGVALKSAQWFLEKHHASEYEEVIRFIIGDIYFKMWEKDNRRVNYEASMQAYREALNQFPKSVLAPRTRFLMGYAAYFNKDYFAALKIFQGIASISQPSLLKDKALLSVARSLLRLNQFDDALKSYESTEKEGFLEANRVEATYLKGDIYFTKKEYKKASEAYQEAMLKYPQYNDQYPSASYNLAESLFWQKLYKASLESYREFLKKFPGHPHASYAMTRAGEAMEILGADQRRVMGAFLEAYFRYGGTEGATIARMRLLSNRMKQMKKKEAEKAIEEIKQYAAEIPLPQIDLFATIMISEGLSQRSEFEKSIDTLLKWYQNNSSTRDARLIRTRIVRHVNEKMADDIENGNFLGALKLHSQYGGLWLKGSGRIDTVYNLGRAFELAGSYKESDTLFRETANLLATNKISADGIEHSVLEKLPSMDEVFLRLAKVKMELGELSKSYDYLKSIKEPERLNENQQVERMDIAIKLLKDKGDLEAAKNYSRQLIGNWKGRPGKVAGVRLKLAQMELDSKEYGKAEKLLIDNLSDLSDAKKIPSLEHLNSLKLLSDTYHAENKMNENSELLAEMLELYPNKTEINSYRFRLGKIYFDEGNVQKASEIWKEFEQKNESFWSKIASGYLKEKEWKDTYQKYIQRIPAMVKANESKNSEKSSSDKKNNENDSKKGKE